MKADNNSRRDGQKQKYIAGYMEHLGKPVGQPHSMAPPYMVAALIVAYHPSFFYFLFADSPCLP